MAWRKGLEPGSWDVSESKHSNRPPETSTVLRRDYYIATMLVGSGLEDRFKDRVMITVILHYRQHNSSERRDLKEDAGPGTAPAYGIRILAWTKPIHQNFQYIWTEMRSILQARTG